MRARPASPPARARRGAERPPVLHVVAPESLRSWFPYFVDLGPGDRVVHVGERPDTDLEPLEAILAAAPGTTAVIHSSHETLERDCDIADLLREAGHAVLSQSRACAALGADKVAMKEFFDRHGFASPPWTHPGDGGLGLLGDPLVVVKGRHATQSHGTRLARRAQCRLTEDELCEVYVDGTEYSVVVYRDEHGVAVFPPVWKGDTSQRLTPPWRRLRLCPHHALAADAEGRLRSVSLAVAEAADAAGHIEIEYLVTPDGGVLVLEINPRIAGTMRLVAMATAVPFFSLHARPDLRGDLPAALCAGELPYSGPAFNDPSASAFATSRLTVGGRTFVEVGEKLELGPWLRPLSRTA